ncbi:MAG: transglutaminase family protein [Acidimicrobiales bacterium]
MRLTISHSTTYRYSEPVRYGLQELRLRPSDEGTQSVVSWDVSLVGAEHQLSFEDHFGNQVELVALSPGATETTVTATGVVETVDTSAVGAKHVGHTPLWFYERSTPRTTVGHGVRQFCDLVRRGDDDIARFHDLSAAIRESVSYETGGSDMESTAESAIEAGAGVCQDHAHIFIAAARHLGYGARYVSGYLLIDDVIDQDATHAWAEVWVNGLGWLGFDVSNGISPDDRYVRVATGLEYRDAAPISGITSGAGDQSLEVELQVHDGSGQQETGQQGSVAQQ